MPISLTPDVKAFQASSKAVEKVVNSLDQPSTRPSHQWLDRKRQDGSDHRAHFYPLPDYPQDPPLSLADIELIPALWREPDRVSVSTRHPDSFLCELDTPDGNTLRMAIYCGGDNPILKTLYKVKK